MNAVLFLFVPAAIVSALAVWWIARAYARGGANPGRIMIASALGVVVALVLYIVIGHPNAPDAPYAGRIAALEARAKTDPAALNADEMLALLEARAKSNPKDFRPLLFAGDILASEQRDAEAARAYSGALAREPGSAAAMIGLGRANVRLEGAVSPKTIALFQAAAQIEPSDPIPWFYQGLAASQEERFADAMRLWREVLKRLPADDPRRTMAQSMLEDASRKTPQQAGR
jgi:cytochrome c-type biogenesis protein CcmH